jgi:hypothetical protein
VLAGRKTGKPGRLRNVRPAGLFQTESEGV